MHIKGEYKTPRTIFCIHIEYKTVGYFKGLNYNEEFIENVKPYLRPMSSMTEEERKHWKDISLSRPDWDFTARCLDWLNTHHFDYRGFIEKGLALEAPKDMYKI